MRPLIDALSPKLRKQIGFAILLAMLSGISSTALLGLSGWFLTAAGIAGGAGVGKAFNHLYPSAGVRGFAFGRVLARYAEQLVGHDATLRYSATLRASIFSAQARALRGFTPMPAKTLATLFDDVEAVESGFLRILLPAATVLASVVAAALVAGTSHLASAGLVLVGAVFGGLLVPGLAVRSTEALADHHARKTDLVRANLSAMIENAVELDVYGALPDQCHGIDAQMQAHQTSADRLERPFRRISPLNAALGGVIALAILLIVKDRGTGVPLAVAGALATLSAFDALGAMTRVMDALPRFRRAAHRLSSLLTHDPAVPAPSIDKAAPVPALLPIDLHELTPQAASTAARACAVSFTIRPKSVTLIEGRSGAGKTTLLETLLRLHPVEPGKLYYHGIDATETRPAAILAHAAMSPQFEAYIPGTLRDQFLLANPGATDEDIWRALTISGLDDVIKTRPEKLETILFEGDPGLSGGEMRRLSLARALINKPALLVLDEPFAGMEKGMAETIATRLTNWAAESDRALVIALHESLAVDWQPLRVQNVQIDAAPQ
ncbi:MAG: amino acid ABC transporter ATP-binding/permease protein [Parvularcula sp.]